MATWTINDVTLEALKATQCKVDFNTLEADSLSFTIEAEEDPGGTYTNGTSIVLKRDGTVFWRGLITSSRVEEERGTWRRVTECKNVWFQFEAATVTTASRPKVVIANGTNLNTAIANIMTNAGAGSYIGTFASTFPWAQITLSQTSLASAIAELCRNIADSLPYFQYTSTAQIFHIPRRGTASTNTLTRGTDPIEYVSLGQVYGVNAGTIVLSYLSRSDSGADNYLTQMAGNGRAFSQVIPVSGLELSESVPENIPESLYCSRVLQPSVSTSDANFAATLNYEPARDYYDMYGSNPWSTVSAGLTGMIWLQTVGSTSGTFSKSGSIWPSSGAYFFGTDNRATPPDWAIAKYSLYKYGGSINVHGFDDESSISWSRRERFLNCFPQYLAEGIATINGRATRWVAGKYPGSSMWYRSNTTQPLFGGTTYYRPLTYKFDSPPAGMASGIAGAQNFTPYEGTIRLRQESPGATRYTGKTLNLVGFGTEYESMGAIVQSESIDITSGTTEIKLGIPPRVDFRQIADKIRRNPQDNVIIV